MSLRLRLALAYTFLLVVLLGVFGVVLYTNMYRSLQAEMDRRLDVRVSQVHTAILPITRTFSTIDLSTAQLDLSPVDDLGSPGLYVQVLDRTGKVVGVSASLRGQVLTTDPSSFTRAWNKERMIENVMIDHDRVVRILSAPIMSGEIVIGVLQVGQARQPLTEAMNNLRNILLTLGLLTMFLGVLGGVFVIYRSLIPLRTIASRAAAIDAERDFSQRVGINLPQDEVGQLATTMDHLLGTVEETLRHHRDFVADTSHELRNPLMAIRTNLELLNRVKDDAARAECLREAHQQVARMSRLVSDLLLLARIEASQMLERRPLRLRRLISTISDEMSLLADGRTITVKELQAAEVLGDEERIAQVIKNLVDNAIKNTPAGGTISLSLRKEDGWALIAVQDTGQGIAPEHLPHIFERFYRVGNQNAAASAGTGLGLAIVRHLVEAQDGWVKAESVLGQGSTFTIGLPLYVRPQPEPTEASNREAEADAVGA